MVGFDRGDRFERLQDDLRKARNKIRRLKADLALANETESTLAAELSYYKHDGPRAEKAEAIAKAYATAPADIPAHILAKLEGRKQLTRSEEGILLESAKRWKARVMELERHDAEEHDCGLAVWTRELEVNKKDLKFTKEILAKVKRAKKGDMLIADERSGTVTNLSDQTRKRKED